MDTTLTDPLVGRVLDGRYRIEARLARGGMATVYVALDERLDRTVAVKVMHAALAEDDAFVDRFIAEARSAARLAHPNVVSVFDQGRDGATVYLVMEHVPGRTLRDVLRQRGALRPAEALSVVDPLLEALAAAHRAGIVHRDVKPENVLLADDGRVKVADFGLARAVAATAATTGLLMGTAAYLAPEQVVDDRADPRSDVYAVGVVLYEMLTGAPPFDGDSPLSVAYRHVNEDVPAPSGRVGGVPPELDELVARATARDPAGRPADAAGLLRQVRALRAARPGPARLSTDTAVLGAADRQTMVVARPGAAPPDRAGRADRPTAPVRGLPRRRRRWPLVLAALVLSSAAAAAAGWWFAVGRFTTVPPLLRQTVASASSRLHQLGLRADVAGHRVFSATVPAGRVAAEQPGPGGRVGRGGTVVLVLSAGPPHYPVPAVAGDPLPVARAALSARRLHWREVTAYSSTVAAGLVVRTDPAPGVRELAGSVVTLTVSRGHAPVRLPDERNRPAGQVLAALARLGLHPNRRDAYSDTVHAGMVVATSPAAPATVAYGGTVTVTVSRGPRLFPVPPVQGDRVGTAVAILRAQGFIPQVIQLPLGPGVVLRESPGAGTLRPHGSTVQLEVF